MPDLADPVSPSSPALFRAFLEMGLSGFGGVLPFARRTLVERRGWLSAEDFNETLALCQSLPGPNIVNMSVVVGARFEGWRGALAAFAGLVIAPFCIVVLLASLWGRLALTREAQGAMRYLAAAATGLAGATLAKMIRPILTQTPLSGVLIMGPAFAAVALLQLPLAWVMAVAAPISVGLAWIRER